MPTPPTPLPRTAKGHINHSIEATEHIEIALNDALTALDDNDPRGAKSDLYHAQYLNLQIQKRLGKIGVAEDEDDEIQALRDQIERLQKRVVELEKLVKEGNE